MLDEPMAGGEGAAYETMQRIVREEAAAGRAVCETWDLARVMSSRRRFAIFSATSAPAPLNFPPADSCVVDQITSPDLFTNLTVAIASCLRS